jgi:serine/threonine protein kinase
MQTRPPYRPSTIGHAFARLPTMAMTPPRWQAIAESAFPWERDALEWLRALLPDRDPWHAWTNFEFIDDQGKVNEVDALILGPTGLYLVEIKSRPGRVDGDAHSWTWTTDGRLVAEDNPLLLANRKSKRLMSVLRRQPSVQKARVRLPWCEPLIFLSATSLDCRLEGSARAGVYLRGQPGALGDPGIVAALLGDARAVADPPLSPVDGAQHRAMLQGMTQAGVRQSNKHRRVNDWQLGALIGEGERWQDWEGRHATLEKTRRRIRIYPHSAAASPEERAAMSKAAEREFQLLEGIEHPGILRIREFTSSERGPALIFDHDPDAVRLDHLLRERGAKLSVDLRLHIVRSLAEAVKHAHGRRLFHRALCPQNVLVSGADTAQPTLRIMNWQTGARDAETGGTDLRTLGTVHPGEYVENPGLVYLAPELLKPDTPPGPHLDVFSLAAIAYHVFSGQPPAGTPLELWNRLVEQGGLKVSDVMDGAPPSLQDLIQYGTAPDIQARYPTVAEFLAELDSVEEELTRPDPAQTVDPSRATVGDRLDGGFVVVRRLGRGSCADVLLVRVADDVQTAEQPTRERVLKVAIDASHDDRVVAEGAVLASLHHANVVEVTETLRIAGRSALLMHYAGESLARRLREGPRLSLDLVRRFGDELIGVVDHLEQQGVAHRDIKPDNIGLTQVGERGRLQLVLFDFSLSRTPVDAITAGTPPYLDPFLPLRKPARWDLQAERFALAVTLYELAIGVTGGSTPRWGDGRSAPYAIEDEVTLDPERFDPALRDGLAAFFGRALRRDPRERFDNAEEMRRAWNRVFDDATLQPAPADAFDALARDVAADTRVGELGYGVEALNVLDGMGIATVADLLAVDRIRFRYLKGVGDRIRKEIRLKARRLAQLRPDLTRGRPTLHDDDKGVSSGAASIDELAAQLVPRRPAGDDHPEDTALATWLGIDEGDAAAPWPTPGDAARAAGIARPIFADTLARARERWLKSSALVTVRDELVALLAAHGGVMTAPEAAQALLSRRGSTERDESIRMRLANGVVRACVESEAARGVQRFSGFDDGRLALLAASVEAADHARRLGIEADAIAAADPLQSPARAQELLEAVSRPEGVAALPVTRLMRLAVAASGRAALSSRLEIYPRAMSALQALRHSLGALAGVRRLTAAQVIERVRGRYPQAEPLPGRPALDALLHAAGADLHWREDDGEGPAYHPAGAQVGHSVGRSALLSRLPTRSVLAGDADSEPLLEARRFEERLAHSVRQGGFLALTVPPREARAAQGELLRRFDLQRTSLDALLLRALRERADARRADWAVVLRADSAAPGSVDHSRLLQLARQAGQLAIERLLASPRPLLLTDPGLLGRWQLTDLIDPLRDGAGRPGALPRCWLLVPMVANALPSIDGVPVPVLGASQWARIPAAWIANRHRAGAPVPQA